MITKTTPTTSPSAINFVARVGALPRDRGYPFLPIQPGTKKPGKPPSLRVDYWSGLTLHSEWVCLEHSGYARQKAVTWWAQRAPGLPVPHNIADALRLTDRLRSPAQIAVRAQGRYTEIVGARFA